MNILIADDHPLVRDATALIVKRLADDVCVVEAANYQAVLDAFTNGSTTFDLAIIDLSMPGREECGDVSNVIHAASETPVVVLSASESNDEARAVLESGARAFIPKSSQPGVLLAALQLVLSGGIYAPVELIEDIANQPSPAKPDPQILTRRQKEVVALLAVGKSNKEISRDLGLSEGTIRTHIAAIFLALNVNNRTQAGNVAREMRLLD